MRSLYILFLFFAVTKFYSQEKKENCKVLLANISQKYKGKCLNGLAEGKGEAKGEDSFVGLFHEGYPEGKGKYTFKNGNFFEGYWKKGKKDGEGVFTFYLNEQEMVQKGFWVDDEFVGAADPKNLINVTTESNIVNYSVKKEPNDKSNIAISIYDANVIFVPQNFEISISSGTKEAEIKQYKVKNFSLPFFCEISYSIFTAVGERVCRFSFEVTKPGNYELMIFN